MNVITSRQTSELKRVCLARVQSIRQAASSIFACETRRSLSMTVGRWLHAARALNRCREKGRNSLQHSLHCCSKQGAPRTARSGQRLHSPALECSSRCSCECPPRCSTAGKGCRYRLGCVPFQFLEAVVREPQAFQWGRAGEVCCCSHGRACRPHPNVGARRGKKNRPGQRGSRNIVFFCMHAAPSTAVSSWMLIGVALAAMASPRQTRCRKLTIMRQPRNRVELLRKWRNKQEATTEIARCTTKQSCGVRSALCTTACSAASMNDGDLPLTNEEVVKAPAARSSEHAANCRSHACIHEKNTKEHKRSVAAANT